MESPNCLVLVGLDRKGEHKYFNGTRTDGSLATAICKKQFGPVIRLAAVVLVVAVQSRTTALCRAEARKSHMMELQGHALEPCTII